MATGQSKPRGSAAREDRRPSIRSWLPLITALLVISCGNQAPDPLAPQNLAAVLFVNETAQCLNQGYSLRAAVDGNGVGTIPSGGSLSVDLLKGSHTIESFCIDGTFRSSSTRDVQGNLTIRFQGYCNVCSSSIQITIYNDTDTSCLPGYPMRIAVDGKALPGIVPPGGSTQTVVARGTHEVATFCQDGTFRSSVTKAFDRHHASVHFQGFCSTCPP